MRTNVLELYIWFNRTITTNMYIINQTLKIFGYEIPPTFNIRCQTRNLLIVSYIVEQLWRGDAIIGRLAKLSLFSNS